MKEKNLFQQLIGLSLIIILLLGFPAVILAQGPSGVRPTVPPATPSSTDPTETPTETATQPSTGSTSSTSKTSSSTTNSNCASIYGVALNWGFGNQSDISVNLTNVGWQANQVTSHDGHYQFGNLGTGVGILTVNPGGSTLKPMLDDAAVRLTCDFHTQANIGLYSGEDRPEPPAQVTFDEVPQTVMPGSTTTLMLKVKNTLPTAISQAILTDLFPDGITVETVTTSKGEVEILDNKMLTVILGELSSGAEESIAVTLRADDYLSHGTELRNTATLFYAESAADQSQVTIAVGGPVASVDSDVSVASGSITELADNATTELSTELPAPETLPVTGLGISLSFVGLLFAVGALLTRGIRSIRDK